MGVLWLVPMVAVVAACTHDHSACEPRCERGDPGRGDRDGDGAGGDGGTLEGDAAVEDGDAAGGGTGGGDDGERLEARSVGATFDVSDVAGVKRFSMAAHDPAHDVFLVVWGVSQVFGRFVGGDGTPIGTAFPIAPQVDTGAPRVVHCSLADQFVVTWLDESVRPMRVQARPVRYVAGAPSFLADPWTVNQNGVGKHTESAPGVIYSPPTGDLVIVWTELSGSWNIRAQRLGLDGLPRGGELDVAVSDDLELFPSITYNDVQDEALVVVMTEPGGPGTQRIDAVRIEPGTGVVHPREPIYEGVYDNYPEVAHDPVTDRYLVVTWHVVGPAIDVYGHLVGADGLPFGALLPIATSSEFEGGDGIGVAFQPRTGTYLVTYQGPDDDTFAVEVDGAGTVSTPFEVIVTPGGLNTQSRAVADGLRARWLVTTNVDYTTVAARFVEALPP